MMGLRTDAAPAAKRLAAASCVGAVLGLLVGGVGGRLFMGLLASLNREDHGVITSDGFPMGEVTTSGTFQLLATGTVIFAGTLYTMALGGPRWLGAITPIGGSLMIAGWLVLAWRVLRSPTRQT